MTKPVKSVRGSHAHHKSPEKQIQAQATLARPGQAQLAQAAQSHAGPEVAAVKVQGGQENGVEKRTEASPPAVTKSVPSVLTLKTDGTADPTRLALLAALKQANEEEKISSTESLESVTSFAQTRFGEHKRVNLCGLKREITIEDHKLSTEQVVAKYDTHLTFGLSKDLARIRLSRNGPNQLTPPKPVSECYKFAKTLFSGFSLLLWVGALLCACAYVISSHIDHLILGLILAGVVLINGLFSYYQESKSSRIIESFRGMVPNYATVIRDGEKDSINATSLVVGDLVEFTAGDRIPADIRLVKVSQLRVDNSSLTGESEPQSRLTEKTSDNPLETKNLAFYASNCVDGNGQGIVIATGDATVMGNIAGLTAQLEAGETPIAKEIDHFVKLITITACTIGIIFFALALLNGYDWLEAVVFLIGVIVANVPEGLLATVTVCLTLTAKRMAGRQCLVKNLEAVETLGSTSVICSDKTGTLTKNVMTVSHCWYDSHMFKCEIHDSRRVRLRDTRSLAWHCMTRAAKLCSRARFRANQHKFPIRRRLTTGDASESAILKWLEYEFGNIVEYRDQQRKVAEIPFNSTNKFALAIYDISHQRRLNHAIMQANSTSLSNGRSSSVDMGGKNQPHANGAKLSLSSSGGGSLQVAKRSGSDSGRVGSRVRSGLHLRSHAQFHKGDEGHHQAIQAELDKLDKNCRFLIVVKGAPERILERCTSIVSSNEVLPLDNRMRANFMRAYEAMGGLGERVIGFADLPLPSNPFDENYLFDIEKVNFPLKGMRFLGLISMIDPPRASVPDAVVKCRDAGIRVIMITGDHPITAQAIARSVGIISDTSETIQDVGKRLGIPANSVDPKMAQAAVIHGNELREMSQQQLDAIIGNHSEIVFARTSPQQKLSIVEACQRTGSIVAVTGDGVNDSPALKKADIGIAMGLMGSDVSKQAADMILLDDNFASIVHGIEEGRLIFDNLKKSIAYTIASNVPELMPFLIYIIVGIPLGLGTVCILLIDLVTDMVPAISLAYEKAETDIMRRRPRNPKTERLVNLKLLGVAYGQVGILQAAAGFFTYFFIYMEHGWEMSELVGIRTKWDNSSYGTLTNSANTTWDYKSRKELEYTCQTAFFVTIVVMQWGDIIISKTRKLSICHQGMDNHVLNFGLLFETVVAALVVYIPGMSLFRLYPIMPVWWLLGLPFCILAVLYDEFRRFMIRRYPGGWLERATYY